MNKNLIKDEKGAVVVLVALMLTILFGITALAVDVGRVRAREASMQSAVDAAALAAVQELPGDTGAARIKAEDYFEYNGYEKEQITNVEFLNSNKKVRVTAATPLDYTFAKIFNNGNTATITKKAAAVLTTPVDDLDYAIFSGSSVESLDFTGTKNDVTGDVHANEDISGKIEVVGEISLVGITDGKQTTIPDGGINDDSPILNMPYLSESELAELEAIAIVFSGDQAFSSADINAYLASYPVIYVDGDIDINGTGVNSSTGSIIATGDITFNGSAVTITDDSRPICLYSTEGNIVLDGQGAKLYGTIWAPNGTVTLNGSEQEVVGKIYGNQVDINGGKLQVTYKTDDMSGFVIKKYKLVE